MKNLLHLLLLCLSCGALTAQNWEKLSDVPASFTFPAVVPLNGNIHIMGGGSVGGATTLHYIYDPQTDTWSDGARIPYMAQQPGFAVTSNSIHYFGGGFPNSGTPLADHYIYDAASESWSQGADLTKARAIHYGIGVGDRVFTMAGQGVRQVMQEYIADSDSWESRAFLPDQLFFYSAFAATDSHIYRFAGGGYSAPTDNCHRYDLENNTWTKITDFPIPVHAAYAATIGDKIFITGGSSNQIDRSEVYMYDTENDEYTYLEGADFAIGRTYHNLVAIDSCLYSLGGHHGIDDFNEIVDKEMLKLCPFNTILNTDDALLVEEIASSYIDGEVHLIMPEDLSTTEVQVFDMSGQVIAEQYIDQLHEGRNSIRMDLNQGYYVLRMLGESKMYTAKFFAH